MQRSNRVYHQSIKAALSEETPLGAWLRKRGVSPYAFARRVGADATQVRGWCSGRSLPGLLYAFKIDQLTEGGVPPESWLGTGLAKLKWREMGVDDEALTLARRRADAKRA